MKPRRIAGFTLIEMMVVIVIIGILAAVLVVAVAGKSDKAKVEGTKVILRNLAKAVEEFNMNHNKYPDKLEDIRQRPSFVNEADWPRTGYGYYPEKLRDAWGNDVIYRKPGRNNANFELISLGQDGRDGGEGYAKDLSYPEIE